MSAANLELKNIIKEGKDQKAVWQGTRGVGNLIAFLDYKGQANPSPVSFSLNLDTNILKAVQLSLKLLAMTDCAYLDRDAILNGDISKIFKCRGESKVVGAFLNTEAIGLAGALIWQDWTHEKWQAVSKNEVAAMAYYVLTDQCDNGELMSLEWYCAKIVFEFFKSEIPSAESIFLIGILYGQVCTFSQDKLGAMALMPLNNEARKKGHKTNTENRKKRIQSLMEAIEAVAKENQAFDQFSETDILRFALPKAKEKQPEVWAVGEGQADEYLGEIRRGEAGDELQKRYQALFPVK